MEVRGNTDIPDEQQVLIIECSVVANPPATIVWRKLSDEGIRTTLVSTSRTSITYQSNSTGGPPTSSSTLMIRNVTLADNGDYICKVENSHSIGPVSANFSVTVTGELLPGQLFSVFIHKVS